MDRITESFNKYYGWILALGIIYIVLGGLAELFMLVALFNVGLVALVGIVLVGVLVIFPSVLLLKFCSNVKEARVNPNAESIEQACRYQALFIIFMGVLALIGVIFMLIGLLFGGAGMAMM